VNNDVTQILVRIDDGDRSAVDELLPRVYAELQNMAHAQMANERANHTLQATALVHEAYLRLVQPSSPLEWKSRGHFFAAAAEAMRRILVEHARRRLGKQRGGDRQRIELPEALPDYRLSPELMIEFNDAIDRLAEQDSIRAQLVKLRFFAGFDREQLGNALGISLAAVDRHWAFVKVWLYRELNASADGQQDLGSSNES